jgi:hypothetical protein
LICGLRGMEEKLDEDGTFLILAHVMRVAALRAIPPHLGLTSSCRSLVAEFRRIVHHSTTKAFRAQHIASVLIIVNHGPRLDVHMHTFRNKSIFKIHNGVIGHLII